MPDPFSSLIQRWTGAKFSHVLFIVDGAVVFHAIEKGVCEEPLAIAVPQGSEIHDRFTIQLPPGVSPREVVAYMRGSLGIGYSIRQCLAIVSRYLRWTVKPGRSEMHCAEFVADVWKNGMGLPAEHLKEIDFSNQREVFESCKAKAKEWGWLT